jgi:hypothetical protein
VVALAGITRVTCAAALAMVWTESRGDKAARVRVRAAA